ncbi:carboxymuconolactone decarboxylase family protein [Camelimonas sp. ID_303_24]
MQQRMNIATAAPALYKAVYGLEVAVLNSGFDRDLLHLIKIRASQLNGCAYCVDMHVKEALAAGLPDRKLHLVSVWRESPLFDARERAALEWTESVTLVAQTGVPDAVYDQARGVFSDEDLARLTVAIGTINVWNRIAVSSRLIHPLD